MSAEQTLVNVDEESRRPVRIGDHLRAAVGAFEQEIEG